MLLASISAQAAELTSKVGRTELSVSETINLIVSYSGQASGEPDFSALNHQFEIIDKSQQSQVSMINGSVTATTTWQMTLLPKGPGSAVIPTFHFNGESSDAIELTIRYDSAKPGQSIDDDKPLFAEVVLDKNSVYVQEQALLTVRLYTRVSLNGYSINDFEIADTKVIQVSDKQQYRKQIGSQAYRVVESRYALFPERSGEIEIPALRFNVSVVESRSRFDNFFDPRGKSTYLHSQAQTLKVKPAPPLENSDHWLPAKNLQLTQTWSPANSASGNSLSKEATVGEPITRTVTVTAEGLTATQLQPLGITSHQNYRLYPDQPSIEDSLSSDGVTGTRIEAMAIVPTQAGTLHLPEIKLRWWDTEAERFRDTLLPGETFEVLPAVGITIENPTTTPANTDNAATSSTNVSDQNIKPSNSYVNPWLVGSNILLLLSTLVFVLLWWRRGATPNKTLNKTQKTKQPDTAKAFKAVSKAAKTDTLPALREAIIQWARLHWIAPEIVTLQQVAAKSAQPALAQHFNWLDKTIYSNEGNQAASGQLDELLALLKQINQDRPDEKSSKGTALQTLYPQ
ncbi:MAG: protein BatD [Porticoccaceae bacterium]|nr:protein BatD [Porticoccaceae bacterium]